MRQGEPTVTLAQGAGPKRGSCRIRVFTRHTWVTLPTIEMTWLPTSTTVSVLSCTKVVCRPTALLVFSSKFQNSRQPLAKGDSNNSFMAVDLPWKVRCLCVSCGKHLTMIMRNRADQLPATAGLKKMLLSG